MIRNFGVSALIFCFGFSSVDAALADQIVEVPPIVVQHEFHYDDENGLSQQILELDGDLPLDQEPMPRLWAIIDESALHRVAGSRQVMEVQLDHLVAMAGQPNVTIQVMPFSQGLTCAYGRAFTILTSRSGSPVVHVEDARSARYLREYEQVMRYTTIFDYLRAGALDDQKSLRLIKGEKQ